jgi:hypothetical protein
VEAQALQAVREGLERRGWRVRLESWEEELELPLGEGLLQRWFAPGAAYRRRLENDLEPSGCEALAALFHRHRGALLPQPLHHTLLHAEILPAAQSPKAPAAQRRTKKPRPEPGPGD